MKKDSQAVGDIYKNTLGTVCIITEIKNGEVFYSLILQEAHLRRYKYHEPLAAFSHFIQVNGYKKI